MAPSTRSRAARVVMAGAIAGFAMAASASGASAWSGAPPAAPSHAPRGVPKPKIDFDPIPFGDDRKRQMANYSHRHYGDREWRLEDPEAIVLHFTATSTYPPVFNTFAANTPALGERPGVCTQFVVDKGGTVHQLTRTYVRCRHAIGLNHVSIGVEMVQEDLGGHASERAILDRDAQARSATRLVAWLKQRYDVPMDDVIGHAMANDSPLFEDRQGWLNDHVDWRRGDVREFRRLVAAVIRSERPHGSASAQAEHLVPRRIVFGRSVQGRRLVARRSGADDADVTALVVGEVHGDEEAGRAVVRRLRRRPGPLGDSALWTVSSLNPDGHERDGRPNANGVDLNRNFAVGWDDSEPEGSGYYPGPAPFSEPESRALRGLIRRLDPNVTIYYHQPWGAVLAPCAGPVPLQRRYAVIAQMPLDRCRGQRLPGTATRWQNEHGGTAFVVELEPGRLSAGQAGRHARAVRAVAAR